MPKVYLGLGSNSRDADIRLTLAQQRLANLPDVVLEKASRRYVTEPQGFAAQPWFSNMVLAMSVGPSWDAVTLLQQMLDIERDLGRVRESGNRFGPRAIDIDLLLYGDEKSDNPRCTLPHPRMGERAFVLVPLLEVAPELCVGGVFVRTMLERIEYRCDGNRIYQ